MIERGECTDDTEMESVIYLDPESEIIVGDASTLPIDQRGLTHWHSIVGLIASFSCLRCDPACSCSEDGDEGEIRVIRRTLRILQVS